MKTPVRTGLRIVLKEPVRASKTSCAAPSEVNPSLRGGWIRAGALVTGGGGGGGGVGRGVGDGGGGSLVGAGVGLKA